MSLTVPTGPSFGVSAAPPTTPPARHADRAPARAVAARGIAKRLVVLAVAAAVVGVAGYRYLWAPSSTGAIVANGTIEAIEVNVAAEMSGRVRAIMVNEGDVVRAGQPVVQLDDTLYQLQFRQADSATQQLLREQIDRLTLRAPRDGTVI
ncbi:MAG: biotin/lipoyl-binding protein, partial [Dehalococcoidia bacterium]|nr:biotin/lipoyl-binding protein [Dehalococcoidia bacterium]